MYNTYRREQFRRYQEARQSLIERPEILVSLEKMLTTTIVDLITSNASDIKRDYDESSLLYPFWQNYPPDKRGRSPRGDQTPWIEVGEHAIGDKLPRLLERSFEIRDTGLPTGPDKRFVLASNAILEATSGLTRSAWLFLDIKSAGPRDNFPHSVMSHNQVSGDGRWDEVDLGVKNSTIEASGRRVSHTFHCSIPPVYVLSDGTVAPVILIALKPVYRMLPEANTADGGGQPLSKIVIASIPNGLLLLEGPNYLKQYPGLFYPGKDDKSKNPLKIRSRVGFDLLIRIARWRVQEILLE
jgi:hypothetical protein